MNGDEFAKRAEYLFDVMAKKNPDKKLYVTDCYFHLGELNDNGATERRREALRRVISGRESIIYIPASTLLTSPCGLSADGIHPNVDGVREIADNWYAAIKNLV